MFQIVPYFLETICHVMELVRKKPSNPTTFIFYGAVRLMDHLYVTCKGSLLQVLTLKYPDCESCDASEGLVKNSSEAEHGKKWLSNIYILHLGKKTIGIIK